MKFLVLIAVLGYAAASCSSNNYCSSCTLDSSCYWCDDFDSGCHSTTSSYYCNIFDKKTYLSACSTYTHYYGGWYYGGGGTFAIAILVLWCAYNRRRRLRAQHYRNAQNSAMAAQQNQGYVQPAIIAPAVQVVQQPVYTQAAVAMPAQPMMQPGQPMMQPGQPMMQPGQPMMQPGYGQPVPIAQPLY